MRRLESCPYFSPSAPALQGGTRIPQCNICAACEFARSKLLSTHRFSAFFDCGYAKTVVKR
jgi:hypothetical protein